MGWRGEIQNPYGSPSLGRTALRRGGRLGASLTFHVNPWESAQYALDHSIGSFIQAATTLPTPAGIITAFRGPQFSSVVQAQILAIHAAGGDSSDASALFNTLVRGKVTPPTTEGALSVLAEAVSIYVSLQGQVYKGLTLAKLPSTPIAASAAPIALKMAANTLLLVRTVGCAAVAAIPLALSTFQYAYTWVNPSFGFSTGYDDATAAALTSIAGSAAPAACAASSQSSLTWDDVQTLIDQQIGAIIDKALDSNTTAAAAAAIATVTGTPASAVIGAPLISNINGILAAMAAAGLTVPAAISNATAALASDASLAPTVPNAVKALSDGEAIYVALQQLVYTGKGVSSIALSAQPLALETAAGLLISTLAESGCAGLAGSQALANFQIAYAWVDPAFAKTGAFDAATSAALAASASQIAGSAIAPMAVCVPAPTPAPAPTTPTPNPAPGPPITTPAPTTNPAPVTVPAPTTPTTVPATTTTPAPSATPWIIGGILLAAAVGGTIWYAETHKPQRSRLRRRNLRQAN